MSGYRGDPQEFVSLARTGFLYQGQYFQWQRKRRGTPSLDLPASAFVTYLENHDQVANTGLGRRLSVLCSPAELRAMTALLLLGPATPMLFQGQEYGSQRPFVYFADRLTSVKGLWRANGVATVLNAAEVSPAVKTLPVASENDNWGDEISVSSDESKEKTSTLWARVKLPDSPELVGKTLKLRIDLAVAFPKLMGDDHWEDASRSYSQRPLSLFRRIVRCPLKPGQPASPWLNCSSSSPSSACSWRYCCPRCKPPAKPRGARNVPTTSSRWGWP